MSITSKMPVSQQYDILVGEIPEWADADIGAKAGNADEKNGCT